MSDRDIQRLLAEKAIESVEPDPATAQQELAVAREHIASAEAIVDRDPTAAFAVGYDAMRKSIAAHMRARGYRTAKGSGHHHRTGQYALAALDGLGVAEDVQAFDDLRQLRNQSEYDALAVEAGEVAELLEHATSLLDAVEKDLQRGRAA